MRLEHHPNNHPRLLRKSALGEVSETKPKTKIKTEPKPQKRKGSRFVGATHLDEDQKAHVCAELKKLRIGDEIGRQIFIGAVEYQLSTFGDRLERQVEPVPRPRRRNTALEKTLQAIKETARLLSGLLRDLPDGSRSAVTRTLTTQDELGRGYDERYLSQLGYEMDRLEEACSAAAALEKPQEGNVEPAACPEFVAKLAEVFSECFEVRPTAEEDGDFRSCLLVLSEVTGLLIGQEPELLAQVLASGTDG